MVRVSEITNELKSGLQRQIRRVYPVIQGPRRWGNVLENRSTYFRDVFPLVKDPLIEAIPQYKPGENSKPSQLKDNDDLTDNQRERLEELGTLLGIAGVDFDLYGHQKEAILGHVKGHDVVVATGTGSGKTEAFLFPMLTHLNDEARRCRVDGKKSQRAIKTLILYPMNALVADQMSRLRKLLGSTEMATKFMNDGYGRFPQFGMYTGRTEFHGWYAEEHENGDDTEWKISKKLDRVKNNLNQFEKLQKRPNAWKEMLRRNKIPSIGGRIILASDSTPEDRTLSFDQLSPVAKKDVLEDLKAEGKTTDTILASRFQIDEKQEHFRRFKRKTQINATHLSMIGDRLDRELIARHQMHLGGVRQYLRDKQSDHCENEEQAESLIDGYGVGIPDTLVTNYSMLEYMLMRPLEHTFWHSTGNWLRECTRESTDSERRRLLLVVDEAHLYQGAMGTEFSLLLNRLLSVLDVDRNRLQFIITSASLGEKEEKKREYVASLLSLHDEPARKAKIVIPASELADIAPAEHENERIGEEVMEILYSGKELLETMNRKEMEESLLERLFDEHTRNTAQEEYLGLGGDVANSKDCHKHILFSCLSQFAPAIRLKRILLRPETLDDEAKMLVKEWYERSEVDLEGQELNRIPRRYALLVHSMFENYEHEMSNGAMDILLDLIAGAVRFSTNSFEQKPFLPLRMHLMLRGDNVARCCSGCGTLCAEGMFQCSDADCNGRTYNLFFDRNCGGAYLAIWYEYSSTNGYGLRSDTDRAPNYTNLRLVHAHQKREFNERTNEDYLLGLLTKVEEDDATEFTHYLGIKGGSILQSNDDPNQHPHDTWMKISVTRHFNQHMEPATPTLKEWEKKSGCLEPRQCLYCEADYTLKKSPQFSNTETRGDEFFLQSISHATSLLDPNDSKQPHRGRKMMLFSDGRQRAAKMALKLKEDLAVDEGRTMFVGLQNMPWFSELPPIERNLNKIYGYYCLLSGSVRLNPLSDSPAQPNRSRMLGHTALLAGHLGNIFPSKEINLILEKVAEEGEDSDHIKENFLSSSFKKALESDVWHNIERQLRPTTNGNEQLNERVTLLKTLLEAHVRKFLENHTNSCVDIMETFNGTWRLPDGIHSYGPKLEAQLELYNEQFSEWSWSEFEKCLHRLGNMIGDEVHWTPHFLKRQFLDNQEIGHLEISETICKNILDDLENGNITLEQFTTAMNQWKNEILVNDPYPSPPRQFGSLVLRWASHNLFGTYNLGLGHFKLIMNDEDRDHLGDIAEHIAYYFPLLFTDIAAVKIPGVDERSTERAILSPNHDKCTKLFTTSTQYESYDDIFQRKKPFVDLNILTQKISMKIASIIERTPREIGLILKAWINMNQALPANISLFTARGQGDEEEFYLNPERLYFIASDETLHLCNTCFTPRYELHENTICINKGCSEKESTQVGEEGAMEYYGERLEIWKQRIDSLLLRNETPRIYRAEEHTAQISEKLDRDDLFSTTELYELMFQDVPLESLNIGPDTAIEQPPIDILSCTTTMEVGIDIGDLTAVALRTVPPHASNYQQRVGRAGRGSAEVSMALTWVDNSSYAQTFFLQPERLVMHPDEPPRIYLNNQKIRQRHFNALCIQRFFKRMTFNPVTLTFEHMNSSSRSLLESLGNLDDFLSGSNASYSAETFIQWLNDVKLGTDDLHAQEYANLKSASTVTDDAIAQAYLTQLRSSIQEWERLHIGGEEE